MSTQPTSRRLATFDQAARLYGVSARTFRNYVGRGLFPAYRMPGVRGLLLDLNEVEAAMRRLPARAAKAAFGSYGPNADIRTLAARPIVVNDGLDR